MDKLIDSMPLLISLLAVVASIFSGIVASALNHRHELKMYGFRFYDERKAECMESYLAAVGFCLQYMRLKNLRLYEDAYSKIFIYTPKSVWFKIEELDSYMRATDFDNAMPIYKELCKTLAPINPRIKRPK
jgi:hypothetical protein